MAKQSLVTIRQLHLASGQNTLLHTVSFHPWLPTGKNLISGVTLQRTGIPSRPSRKGGRGWRQWLRGGVATSVTSAVFLMACFVCLFRCPTRKQNRDYAMYLLTVLYHESWVSTCTDSWVLTCRTILQNPGVGCLWPKYDFSIPSTRMEPCSASRR